MNLVERLRSDAKNLSAHTIGSKPEQYLTWSAADRIEELEKALEEMSATARQALLKQAKLEAEVERLRESQQKAHDRAQLAESALPDWTEINSHGFKGGTFGRALLAYGLTEAKAQLVAKDKRIGKCMEIIDALYDAISYPNYDRVGKIRMEEYADTVQKLSNKIRNIARAEQALNEHSTQTG